MHITDPARNTCAVGEKYGRHILSVEKQQLFERAPIPRAVMTLAIPTVLSSLVMVLYNLADTYFVGMLNDSIQNAAVTLATPVLLAFNAVNNLFGVGTSSLMSRALGRKDYDTVSRASAFGFYCTLFFASLLALGCGVFRAPLLTLLGAKPENLAATGAYLRWTAVCGAVPAILNVVMAYLVRSEGAALHASIGTMSGCLLNIVLDPIFILPWGLNMGAAGAGCATFLSNCAACCYFFVLLFVKRGKTYVCVDPRKFGFRKDIVREIFTVGVPASIQNLLNVTGMTILNNFASDFGSDAVAAMGIAQKLNMIPMQIALGTSQGVMPLVSYNYASGNVPRMKKAFLFTAKLAVGFLLFMAGAYYLLAPALIGVFMDITAIVNYGARFLRGMCLGLPFIGIDFMGVGTYQATGKGLYSLIFAILRKVVLEIPALFLLNWLFPLYGLAYAQSAAEFILSIAAVVVLRRLFRRFEAEAQARRAAEA